MAVCSSDLYLQSVSLYQPQVEPQHMLEKLQKKIMDTF